MGRGGRMTWRIGLALGTLLVTGGAAGCSKKNKPDALAEAEAPSLGQTDQGQDIVLGVLSQEQVVQIGMDELTAHYLVAYDRHVEASYPVLDRLAADDPDLIDGIDLYIAFPDGEAWHTAFGTWDAEARTMDVAVHLVCPPPGDGADIVCTPTDTPVDPGATQLYTQAVVYSAELLPDSFRAPEPAHLPMVMAGDGWADVYYLPVGGDEGTLLIGSSVRIRIPIGEGETEVEPWAPGYAELTLSDDAPLDIPQPDLDRPNIYAIYWMLRYFDRADFVLTSTGSGPWTVVPTGRDRRLAQLVETDDRVQVNVMPGRVPLTWGGAGVPSSGEADARCTTDGLMTVGQIPIRERWHRGETDLGAVEISKARPVEACGIDEVVDWLDAARCPDGSKAWPDAPTAYASRSGSVGGGGRCGSVIDLYIAPCPSGDVEVYADMYSCPDGRLRR